MSKNKQAVILAGGKGTRLRPYTTVLPKPLMPLGDRSILELIINQLAEFGFTDIILAVNHQASIIQALIGDGSKYGVKIRYVLEDKVLGTMGPLSYMKEFLQDQFIVMNGDILTDLKFDRFLKAHEKSKKIFSISAFERVEKIDYGVLLENKNTLTGFKEKPSEKYLVSMGIYAVNKEILKYIPAGQAFGFDQLMLSLLKKKKHVNIIKHHGDWLDIGRPDDYMKAIDLFENKKADYIHQSKK